MYFLSDQIPIDILVLHKKRERNGFDFFGTETTIIDFIPYPFINGSGFNYEMMMLLFTWIGFLGFVYAYLFFKENIPLKVKVFKRVDLLTLILFFPTSVNRFILVNKVYFCIS